MLRSSQMIAMRGCGLWYCERKPMGRNINRRFMFAINSYKSAKGLKNKLWDVVRETPRFAAIVRSLEKVAK